MSAFAARSRLALGAVFRSDDFAMRPEDLSLILATARTGDAPAMEQVFQLLYAELRRLAHHKLKGSALTLLHTTALVHECYERMLQAGSIEARDSGQFLAYASRAMRSVLVDHARSRLTERRGGAVEHVELDAAHEQPSKDEEIVKLHEALHELEARDAQLARVVEMRYFAGLTEKEIAVALGVTERTVRRYWEKARLLLFSVMQQ